MLATQRHNQIQVLLQQHGAVSVSQLMDAFGISMETARRDLAAMEKAGLLVRVHGGALPLETARFYRPLNERMQEQQAQKHAIARAAAAQVNEGDYIAISSGSTALAFARELRMRVRKLTVVTYSLDVFEALQDLPEYTVLFTGGQYYPAERSFTGPVAAAFLDGICVQKSFLCPSVLSLEEGITCRTEELVHRLRPMIRNSDQVYVLADSRKFQQHIQYQVTPMRRDFVYITDNELPEALRKKYADHHLKFIYAE